MYALNAVVAGSTGVYLADPMTTPTSDPIYLDSGQFAAIGIALAMIVCLLAAILIGQWRR